jgi:hypothetical protein
MISWWRDLSITKKLYLVVALMATLIASELLTLLFAMNTLSAVRAIVAAEGLWAKAQKNAVLSLFQYALDADEKDFVGFEKGYFAKPETRQMIAGRDLTGRRKDGSEVPIEVGLNPVQTEEGKFAIG